MVIAFWCFVNFLRVFSNTFIVLSICLYLSRYTVSWFHKLGVLGTLSLNGHVNGFKGGTCERGLGHKDRTFTTGLIHS